MNNFTDSLNDIITDLLSKLKLNSCINIKHENQQKISYLEKIEFIDRNYPGLSQKQKQHIITYI